MSLTSANNLSNRFGLVYLDDLNRKVSGFTAIMPYQSGEKVRPTAYLNLPNCSSGLVDREPYFDSEIHSTATIANLRKRAEIRTSKNGGYTGKFAENNLHSHNILTTHP